jgi:hypothetical protein
MARFGMRADGGVSCRFSARSPVQVKCPALPLRSREALFANVWQQNSQFFAELPAGIGR